MKYLKTLLIIGGLVVSFLYGDFSLDKREGAVADLYYDNIQYTDNVEFYGADGLNLRYSGELQKPGDYYEIVFDVVNPTSTDVEIAKCAYQKDDSYVHYQLQYIDGSKIQKGDTLKKGERRRLKYRVSYVNSIQSDSYEFDASFYIYYEQSL